MNKMMVIKKNMHQQQLNYKYRIYPNRVCESVLESNLEACRFLYNHFIEQGYDNEYDMSNALPELKDVYPELKNYHAKMLQMVSKKVASINKALKRLKNNGYKISKPIKDEDEYNSFTYNQSGFKLVNRENRWYLWLSKIGYIKIKLYSMVDGMIKQVTVKRNNNKWYAIFTVEGLYPIFKFINLKNKIVALYLGIKSFIVDSNSNDIVDRQEELNRLIRRLKLVQRRIARGVKGSNNYNKAKRWYQIIHERIADKRKDFLHKISRIYANRYDIIFVEKLNTKRLLEYKSLNNNNRQNNSILHKHISESSFRSFIDMLKAKLLISVDPKNTSKECCICSNIVKKSLQDRIHYCYNCNINKIDRDCNASLNILKRGLEELKNLNSNINLINPNLPMEHGEFKPVETLTQVYEAGSLTFKSGVALSR